jgi:hypothetical protein
MSLDRIIQIHITSQGVPLAQAGFGVPLILGKHNQFKERVKAYGSLEEMDQDGFKGGPILEMAVAIFSQEPSVPIIKVGRRVSKKITEDLHGIWEEDSNFYGLLIDSNEPKDIESAAEWAETKRILFGASAKKEFNLKEKAFKRTFLAFHETNNLAAAMIGKVFPKPPGSSSWAFQRLAAIAPSILKTSDEIQLDAANVNRYASIKGMGVTLQGKVCSGEYIDTVRGVDWLHARMQERLFVLLMKNKKIPYTEKGIDLVRSEIMAQLNEGIYAGVLAADPDPTVSAPKMEAISSQNKIGRVLPNIFFSGRLAGAIHTIQIQGTVSV